MLFACFFSSYLNFCTFTAYIRGVGSFFWIPIYTCSFSLFTHSNFIDMYFSYAIFVLSRLCASTDDRDGVYQSYRYHHSTSKTNWSLDWSPTYLNSPSDHYARTQHLPSYEPTLLQLRVCQKSSQPGLRYCVDYSTSVLRQGRCLLRDTSTSCPSQTPFAIFQ
jgi:hypothetical protein